MHELAMVSPHDVIRSRAVPWTLRRVFRSLLGIKAGCVDVGLPDGRTVRFSGTREGPHAGFNIHSYAFLKRLAGGDIGFAEGYIAGEWDTPNLVALLALLADNQHLIDRFSANGIVRLIQKARHALNRNSRSGSRRNIHAHYDLGNAFYGAWLDRTMTYSSGLEVGQDLVAAQHRKYAAIAAAAGVEQHHHVLEIGCGWGGFAEYAAREIGCRVTALTISPAQFEFARQRIAEAGLSNRVTLKLCDYRDEQGTFDRIVSIEMFEAVGQEFWKAYFAKLEARLVPGGRAALQVITIREDIFPRYLREMDFIRHYIFPGGMLPTPSHLRALGESVGFEQTSELTFGGDYAATCRAWRERFDQAWTKIASLGFDDRFRRLWRYYLAYCEAGFSVGTIDVCQIGFRKSPDTGG